MAAAPELSRIKTVSPFRQPLSTKALRCSPRPVDLHSTPLRPLHEERLQIRAIHTAVSVEIARRFTGHPAENERLHIAAVNPTVAVGICRAYAKVDRIRLANSTHITNAAAIDTRITAGHARHDQLRRFGPRDDRSPHRGTVEQHGSIARPLLRQAARAEQAGTPLRRGSMLIASLTTSLSRNSSDQSVAAKHRQVGTNSRHAAVQPIARMYQVRADPIPSPIQG